MCCKMIKKYNVMWKENEKQNSWQVPRNTWPRQLTRVSRFGAHHCVFGIWELCIFILLLQITVYTSPHSQCLVYASWEWDSWFQSRPVPTSLSPEEVAVWGTARSRESASSQWGSWTLNHTPTGTAVRGETERKFCWALNIRVLMFY